MVSPVLNDALWAASRRGVRFVLIMEFSDLKKMDLWKYSVPDLQFADSGKESAACGEIKNLHQRWRCKTDNKVEAYARYDRVVMFLIFFLEFLAESFIIFYIKISQIKCTENSAPFSKFCINF